MIKTILASPQLKKHSVRYDSPEPDPAVRTIYVSKTSLHNGVADTLICVLMTMSEYRAFEKFEDQISAD